MHWVNQCIGNEYHSSDIIQSVTQSQHAVRINPETWKNFTQQLPGALNPHVRQATCTVLSHLRSSSLWRSDMMMRRTRKRAVIKQISEDNVKNRGNENSKSRFKSPQGAIDTDCAFLTGDVIHFQLGWKRSYLLQDPSDMLTKNELSGLRRDQLVKISRVCDI